MIALIYLEFTKLFTLRVMRTSQEKFYWLANWLQRGRYENTSHIWKCTEGIHKYSFAEGYEKSRSRECRVAGFS
ncbi:hypothetical protein THICB3600021 [Thiomonas sp. CB3]|nr:hypothetical protein THICB3600021 [Thiomonas sp. CB3]